MRRYDKIFAALILVAMAGFWVVIAPAGLGSRSSEALPLAIDTATEAEPPELQTRPAAAAEKRSVARPTRIDRLKLRDRDTPSTANRQYSDLPASDNSPDADTGLKLQSPDAKPDIPVFY